ncbi:MAG: D-alanyl-D-alanine carboxypeptidase/D-alanyl-D-alanine-endopeptidase [Acidobacteriota bacterium]|nr:D-alanyl-D-alanine carboxypeptidase/D-alanyl-D-alanine-endopeptidase [Acidobacteriota bacterium]
MQLRSLRAVVALLLVLVLSGPVSASGHRKETHKESPKELARQIDALLEQPTASRAAWGIAVEDLATGAVVYSHDAERLFTPASNAKLFTTATAWARLGAAYQFHTTLESATAPDQYGRLAGDLVLVGRGDPNLSGRALPYEGKTQRPFPPDQALAALADQLAARGVKVIDGDLVADDSFYSNERYGQGWAQNDLVWEYGAAVSALAINDNAVFVNIKPGAKEGDRAFVSLAPAAEYFDIDNRITTSATGERKLGLQRELGSRHVELWGAIPLTDAGTSLAVALEDPAEYCARLLHELLLRRGIEMHGKVRVHHSATPPESAPLAAPARVVLAEHVSAPLGQDLMVINKVSQNLHAEMLLRLLGREKGTGGSIAGGLQVVKEFLSEAGISPDEFAFYDGSGLSRQNLVTPHATVKLLRYSAQQPWGADFAATLPVAGTDGTLAGRLKSLPAGAVVQAKTGTLDHVNAISGYLTTVRGERYAFAIFCNNNTLENHGASQVIDAILAAVANAKN